MTIGDLRKYIEGMPDEFEILKPGFDHSFDKAEIKLQSVRFKKGMGFTEDWGDDYEKEYGPSQEAVVVI